MREHDTSKIGPIAPDFIAGTVRTALQAGYHVVLEGILHTERYGPALHQLISEHPGPSAAYYLDVSYRETVRRHQHRPQAQSFSPADMLGWYVERDLLGITGEHVISEDSPLKDTVTTILHTSGLTHTRPTTPCPTRCPHCMAKQAAAQTPSDQTHPIHHQRPEPQAVEDRFNR